MSARAPNIVVVQADQLTPLVLPAHGDRIAKTPHIDRLCSEGVLFENAYCNSSLCAPSRFSMMAGRLCSEIGAYDNGAEFPASVPTFAHYLRLAGYDTCLAGKMHFVGPDQLHGFEERLTGDIYPADFIWTGSWDDDAPEFAADNRAVKQAGVCARSMQLDYDDEVRFRAVRKIHDVARDPGRRPLLLVASFIHPHDPYLCLREHWDRYHHDDIPLPAVTRQPRSEREPHTHRILVQHSLDGDDVTDAHVRNARHGYYGSTSYFDDQVGRLLGALEETGLAEDTVVVLTSDHGEMLGERGLWFKKVFFEHAMRVPLVVHAPARFRPARVGAAVSLVDLLPTLLGLADETGERVEPATALDGQSLIPYLEGKAVAHSSTVLGELLCEGTPAPLFMVRRGRYKYVASSADPAQLYDVEADPDEVRNLSGDPALAGVERELAAVVSQRWDAERLGREILDSQRRRRFVRGALLEGARTRWDHRAAGADEGPCYRGEESYNDWAYRGQPDLDG